MLLVRSSFASAVILVQLALPLSSAFANEVTESVSENTESEESVENVLVEVSAEGETSDVAEVVSEDSGPLEESSTVPSEPEVPLEIVKGGDAVLPNVLTEEANLETQILNESTEDLRTSDIVIEGETAVNDESNFEPTPTPAADGEVSIDNDEVSLPEDGVSPAEEEQDESNETLEEAPTSEEADAATSSQNVVEPELHTVNLEESSYTFGLDDCARVADGSFYCTPESEARGVTADRVFSAPDADGDNEIFIEKSGELLQLTHNLLDDAAPYYDERSNTIVFHRLVEARYQIFSLDLNTLEETQLTQDSYNNMQPSRYGDLIVWQGWVGNDWEILTSEDSEITMLTDNVTHDIGPRINGEYVIWQAEEIDGWKVRIFNTLTGETESIDDADGASIENPRLVLVYDAKHENGDIETRGYDLDTGKKVALAAQAPILPEELPDPDQTGEERALISAVTQLKPKTDDEDAGEPEALPLDPMDDVASSTNSLVIPPFDEVVETGTSTPELSDDSISDIPDIVIPTVDAITEEPPVPDLVIPEFVPSEEPVLDSQDEVAETP